MMLCMQVTPAGLRKLQHAQRRADGLQVEVDGAARELQKAVGQARDEARRELAAATAALKAQRREQQARASRHAHTFSHLAACQIR